jgi:chaperonin GroES
MLIKQYVTKNLNKLNIMSLNIKQLIGDKVLIEPAPAETKTASGLYIPETAQEKPAMGTVVAAGPGRVADLTGTLIPMTVKAGDKVLYSKFAGQESPFNGVHYLLMRESDISAILL